MTLIAIAFKRIQLASGYNLRPSGAPLLCEPLCWEHLRCFSITPRLDKNKYRLQPLFLPPNENAAGLRQRKGRKPKPYKAKDEMKYRNDPRWAGAFHEDEHSPWDSEEAKNRPRLKGTNGGRTWIAPNQPSKRERFHLGPPKWVKGYENDSGTFVRDFGLDGGDKPWKPRNEDPDMAPDAPEDDTLIERPFFKSNYEPGSLEKMPLERVARQTTRPAESLAGIRRQRESDETRPTRRLDELARKFTSPWNSAIRDEKTRGSSSESSTNGSLSSRDSSTSNRFSGSYNRPSSWAASEERRGRQQQDAPSSGINDYRSQSPSSANTTGWSPKKKLSIPAMAGLKQLHAEDPAKFSVDVLSEKFGISHEAVKRVLRSRFRENEREGRGSREEDEV